LSFSPSAHYLNGLDIVVAGTQPSWSYAQLRIPNVGVDEWRDEEIC
jgi:hypothetical protein